MRFSFEHPDASLLFGKFERFLQNSTSTTTFRCFNKIDRMHFIKSSKGGTRVACKCVFWMKSGLPSYQNQNSALQEGVFLSEQILLKKAIIMTFLK